MTWNFRFELLTLTIFFLSFQWFFLLNKAALQYISSYDYVKHSHYPRGSKSPEPEKRYCAHNKEVDPPPEVTLQIPVLKFLFRTKLASHVKMAQQMPVLQFHSLSIPQQTCPLLK